MKHKLLVISLLFIMQTSIVDANTWTWCLWSSYVSDYNRKCNNKFWFELYECRVTSLCNSCNNPKTKKIFEVEEYKEAQEYQKWNTPWTNTLTAFYKTKEIYTENMNSIYKCALIDIQERWLDYLQKIVSATDKSGLVIKNIQPKINDEKSKLSIKKRSEKCWWLKSEDTKTNIILKKEVLDQVSLEFCKYSFYLDYLSWYYQRLSNLLWVDPEKSKDSNTHTEISTINTYYSIAQNEISTQYQKVHKVFPLAFYAYSEYEENYIMHLMLNIIKSDYVIARDLLAQTLWPINQVVYKIKDAMRKY